MKGMTHWRVLEWNDDAQRWVPTDTVVYYDNMARDDVKLMLVAHDGYPESIALEEVSQ